MKDKGKIKTLTETEGISKGDFRRKENDSTREISDLTRNGKQRNKLNMLVNLNKYWSHKTTLTMFNFEIKKE